MRRRPDGPAVFHVTHYKAGSQWIYAILRNAVAGERLVAPAHDGSQFLAKEVQAGKVYPTLYITREQFESVDLPSSWRRFVVIRDLRDTLVSGYFSIRDSHPPFQVEAVERLRTRLREIPEEEGLLHMIEDWLPDNTRIQSSWCDGDVLRYEDLLAGQAAALEPVLIESCELPTSRRRLRRAIRRASFERQSGRPPGVEDVGSHHRKATPGDWRNHFTPAVRAAFKETAGSVLIAAGYERSADW